MVIKEVQLIAKRRMWKNVLERLRSAKKLNTLRTSRTTKASRLTGQLFHRKKNCWQANCRTKPHMKTTPRTNLSGNSGDQKDNQNQNRLGAYLENVDKEHEN